MKPEGHRVISYLNLPEQEKLCIGNTAVIKRFDIIHTMCYSNNEISYKNLPYLLITQIGQF